eukprot:7292062-Pyramimonas_sp.AAC.1
MIGSTPDQMRPRDWTEDDLRTLVATATTSAEPASAESSAESSEDRSAHDRQALVGELARALGMGTWSERSDASIVSMIDD